MESFLLILTASISGIACLNAIFRPQPFQQNAHACAKKRGHSRPLILISRSLCHLTQFGQWWIIAALFTKNNDVFFVAQAISWIIFCLYHGMNLWNPQLLAYHEKNLVDQVVRWSPPSHPFHVLIWFGLHYQHTLPPLYMHYFAYTNVITYSENTRGALYTVVAMIVYTLWHLYCWKIQGIPAYPFLKEFRNQSFEVVHQFHYFIHAKKEVV